VSKRLLDITVSLLVLVVTSPLAAIVAVAVRAVMGSPVLFRQQRAGKDGRPFTLVKFRTMRAPLRPGGEYDDEAERLTPLGRFLRSTSLDELPTLGNVIRGQMSLVGPRPLPVEYNDHYSPRQRQRLATRPGVTGLAQVNGRNALSWPDKLELDVQYVENRSLALDLKILLRTVRLVVLREGVAMEGHTSSPRFIGSSDQRS
jgi:lipopolysaccharide/colanic/teichoic acid biosynthesis glycosyltransferase